MADPVVELRSGLIRGIVERHDEGFDYYAFKGIPYAEPPVGELRFEDPVPVKKWKGVIDCKNFGPMCAQYDYLSKTTGYSEDCLYLNVYSKSIKNEAVSLPVMVIVHAGSFISGCGDDSIYGPDYLIRKDIVMVTVNFRLGVWGFLNLEDEVAPGNQALRDLVMALQWVQQNIRVFGGNRNNVTLFGIGTGGSAANVLALSSQTKGLIHKVISQGTVPLNLWMLVNNPKLNAIKLCSLLGKDLKDSREILRFLKTVDSKRLFEAQKELWTMIDTLPFTMAIDSKSSDPFIPVHPYLAVSQCVQLPYLLGYAANDGTVAKLGMSRKTFYEMVDKDFNKILIYNSKEIVERYGLTDKQMRRLYYKNEIVSENNLNGYADLTCDIHFLEGIHKTARVQSEQSSAPTYLYKFSYEASISLVKRHLKNPPAGATHLDDLPFLFKMRATEAMGFEHLKKGTIEYKLMEQMTEMYANFAKYGRPTIVTSDLIPVHWKPVADGTLLRYLNIDEDITMQYTVNVDQKLLGARDIIA